MAETLTSAEITEQTQTEVERSLRFLTVFLAIFSFIALGVGMFVIYNVFSITAAQRQRENALLARLGASRRQVTWSMLIEAVVVGISVRWLGLFGGVGLALGHQEPARRARLRDSGTGLAVEPPTIVITIVAGLVASLVAALGPAIGAGRVPPVAAMSRRRRSRNGARRPRPGDRCRSGVPCSASAAIVAVMARRRRDLAGGRRGRCCSPRCCCSDR